MECRRNERSDGDAAGGDGEWTATEADFSFLIYADREGEDHYTF